MYNVCCTDKGLASPSEIWRLKYLISIKLTRWNKKSIPETEPPFHHRNNSVPWGWVSYLHKILGTLHLHVFKIDNFPNFGLMRLSVKWTQGSSQFDYIVLLYFTRFLYVPRFISFFRPFFYFSSVFFLSISVFSCFNSTLCFKKSSPFCFSQ